MNGIINKNLDKIIKYCKKYDVKELYVTGSVLTDNFSENSDIDLLVKFNEIPIEKYTDNYFILISLFEKLFNRKIDLITDKSLKNPFLINSINKNKKLLYAGKNK